MDSCFTSNYGTLRSLRWTVYNAWKCKHMAMSLFSQKKNTNESISISLLKNRAFHSIQCLTKYFPKTIEKLICLTVNRISEPKRTKASFGNLAHSWLNIIYWTSHRTKPGNGSHKEQTERKKKKKQRFSLPLNRWDGSDARKNPKATGVCSTKRTLFGCSTTSRLFSNTHKTDLISPHFNLVNNPTLIL